MINKRLFGSSLKPNVKKILEFRQGDDIVETTPGDSIDGTVTGQREPFRLDDKTPFVRMWTSVKLIEPSVLVDITKQEVENDPDLNFELQENDGSYSVDTSNFPAFIPADQVDKVVSSDLEKKYGSDLIVPVRENKEIIGYAIKKKTRQENFVRKIYEVGNHTYQENYGEVKVNESVGSPLEVLGNGGVDDYQELLPSELNKNQYLKPQAGITSISSETEGALGVIKKTTVNFVVHNFQDYDKIYNKYFLKPGATIFVDFGWSDIKNLYRPSQLLDNEDNIQNYLYSESDIDGDGAGDGFITSNQGKVEVLQGIVNDYDSKVLPNGSVECSVTLTSSNNALLGLSLDEKIVSRVKDTLQRGILYLGIRQLVTETDEDLFGQEYNTNDLQQLQSTPNYDSSATTIDEYEKNIKGLAIQQLSGTSGPEGNAIRTGIFVDSLAADNIYIAWGLFEDLIINSQFGFGKSKQDIELSKSFQVTLNSETSFTKWSKLYNERQKTLLRVPEDAPVFVFPDWWADSDPEDIGGSYSFQKNKFPLFDYEEKEKSGIYDSSTDKTTFDKNINGVDGIGRIPIREVFVNIENIISAFESEDSIQAALEKILDDMNEDSDGFFNWSLLVGEPDSQIKVIDKQQAKEEDTEDLFTFKIMSPKSIVQSYDLSFKLPSGNLGNMYAIQGMSHGNSLFTVDTDVLDIAAIGATDAESLSIIYEPDLGSLRLEELLDQKNTAEEETIYDTMEDVFSTNTFSTKVKQVPNLIEGTDPLTTEGVVEDTEISQIQNTETESDELVQKNDRVMELKGYKVAKSFRDYYKIKIIKEAVSKNRPILLPYTLSLTIYGISSILPGDKFKVDYLPQMYLDTTALQTTKVSHDVGPGGWYTTLETQFRLLPTEMNTIQNIDRAKVRLSPTVLNKQSFEEEIEALDGLFNNSELNIKDITPFMTDVKILDLSGKTESKGGRLDYVLSFVTTSELKGILTETSPSKGEISHYDTSFYAYFGIDVPETWQSLSLHNLETYLTQEWYDWVNPVTYLGKQIANYTTGGSDSIYNDIHFRAVTSGIYFYPPHCKLEPNQKYFFMAFGDAYAIVDPRHNGEAIVKYFDDYIGDNSSIF